MGKPAAKQGDKVLANDTHLIQPPPPAAVVPVVHPFSGVLNQNLSRDVSIDGLPAATVDSIATNLPPHVPLGGTFVNPPRNQGQIIAGSQTVLINGKGAARAGDVAKTCNDPTDMPVGKVVATSRVLIGD